MRLLKTLLQIEQKSAKIRVYARLLVKIRVSQLFLDPIQNRISAKTAHLEVAYLEALLYSFLIV